MRMLLGLMVVLVATGGLAKGKNTHRKIKKGVGNCVFAAEKLVKGQEAGWPALKTKFASDDEIHARCYWDKPLDAYKKLGKATNELRDTPSRYRIALEVRAPELKGKQKKAKAKKGKAKEGEAKPLVALGKQIVRVSATGEGEWDERGYDLTSKVRKCLFPPEYGMDKCLDISAMVIEQASLVGKAIPYTAPVCLSTYIVYEDVTGGEKEKLLSEGCFEYTANKLPLPPQGYAGERAPTGG